MASNVLLLGRPTAAASRSWQRHHRNWLSCLAVFGVLLQVLLPLLQGYRPSCSKPCLVKICDCVVDRFSVGRGARPSPLAPARPVRGGRVVPVGGRGKES